jgi:hypothetical protein
VKNNMNTLIPNAATAPDTTPVTPDALVAQLRAMRAHIPDYGQLPVPKARQIRAVAHVDGPFVQATINAAGASDRLQTTLGRTPEQLQQETEDAARWTAVEDELRAMLKGVASANLVRRHRIGLAALQTYSVSRQLVREEGQSDLLPHLAEMKRLNKFGRTRKASVPNQGPQPSPKPPVPPSSPNPGPQPLSANTGFLPPFNTGPLPLPSNTGPETPLNTGPQK